MGRFLKFVSCLVLAGLLAGCTANLQTPPLCTASSASSGPSATGDAETVTLRGNTPAAARAEFDQGLVAGETRLDEMILLLKPSAAQRQGLDALVAAQQDRRSPLYHRWLTPAEYGERFGASPAELMQAASWLALQGFSIEEISAGRRTIFFSGTARQVSNAFHVEMHRYSIGGADHVANADDPQIPAALGGVVEGVVSLHDFRRVSQIATHVPLAARRQYSAGGTHYLFPADFATIYDLATLQQSGVNGAGVAIAVIGRSNIDADDVAQFRAAAGLPPDKLGVVLAGADPGLVKDDRLEATLDVEWSGAVAPEAAVTLVAAPSTAVSDGVDVAAAYAVNHATAPIVSVSYSACEQQMGAAELAFYNALWEQAASEGMSVFVASGDAGAAGCSAATDITGTRAAINGLCASPYATCVGGTEFNEGSNPSQFWAPGNGSGYGSALGYIPETVWNESGLDGGSGLAASGGGVSSMVPQPGWQAEMDGAAEANGMRGAPDVALTAADHDGSVVVENGLFMVVSGTSVAAPSFAGIMALVVDGQGREAQGSANPRLYALAAATPDALHPTPSGNNSVPGVEGFAAGGEPYNLATGLGSVDGAALVGGWATVESEDPAHVDFVLTASPQSGTVTQGGAARFVVGVQGNSAANDPVALNAVAPAGVSARFSSASVLPGTSAAVTVSADASAMAGAQTITIIGSDASGEQALDYSLTIVARAAVCSAAY